MLGLEQFDIPNALSSHHGHSRMIRLAYFEHADYVTLLKRAYELWYELEAESGEKLLHVTGGVYLGRPGSELVLGSIEAARTHDLAHEVLSRDEVGKRFGQFHVPDDTIAFYENDAGFLIPEAVVAAQAQLAMLNGAEMHGHEEVLDWTSDGKKVTVKTNRGVYEGRHLIVSAGAWTTKLLKDLDVSLRVSRQTFAWFWPSKPELFELGRFPSWALDMTERSNFHGIHYGFPMMPDNPGLKIALHWPGETTEPDVVDRSVHAEDEAELRQILEQYLPDAVGPLLSMQTCLYTNTSDGHFIIDQHPGFDNVTVACGFSGHGFKFTSVVGQVLAELAVDGEASQPIGFLGLDRFAKGS